MASPPSAPGRCRAPGSACRRSMASPRSSPWPWGCCRSAWPGPTTACTTSIRGRRRISTSAPPDADVGAANYIRPMILDRFLVSDQAAVVTASGRGIGAAAAIALAQAGADVVLAARTEDQLLDVAKQVEAAGRRAAVVTGDLTDFDLMASLAETAWKEYGRIDIVVNNMGGTMPRPFLDTSPRFLEEAFRFNVSAGHALLRAAVPRMLEGDHPGGAIVSISSVMGH